MYQYMFERVCVRVRVYVCLRASMRAQACIYTRVCARLCLQIPADLQHFSFTKGGCSGETGLLVSPKPPFGETETLQISRNPPPEGWGQMRAMSCTSLALDRLRASMSSAGARDPDGHRRQGATASL